MTSGTKRARRKPKPRIIAPDSGPEREDLFVVECVKPDGSVRVCFALTALCESVGKPLQGMCDVMNHDSAGQGTWRVSKFKRDKGER